MLLEGGLDWKPLSLSPKDMDFIEAKNSAAREIALALGVPPMLLGIPGDNTYSNYAEAQRAFWRRHCAAAGQSHDAGVWRVAWSRVRRPARRRESPGAMKIELRADLDQVEALNPEREALWARLEGRFVPHRRREAVGGGVWGTSCWRFRLCFVDPRLRGEAGSAEVFTRSATRACGKFRWRAVDRWRRWQSIRQRRWRRLGAVRRCRRCQTRTRARMSSWSERREGSRRSCGSLQYVNSVSAIFAKVR